MRYTDKAFALFSLLLLIAASRVEASSLRGIDDIGLRVSIRIEANEAVERMDETYLRNLIDWQLDQYRVKVSPHNPGLPYLSVKIEVERLLGPARLSDEAGREIEGVFQSSVEVEFHQQVVSKENPAYEFWAPTYRRASSATADSRQELQRILIRNLERNLLGFINTFRRANPK